MVLNSRDTTVAYRCPFCGASVYSVVGIFSLSADMVKLKCGCGKSEMTVTYTSDRKIRLNVPCLICPTSHNYVISSNTFFEKATFTLTCNFTGIDVCFIGTKDGVAGALRKSEAEITQMLKEAGIDDFDAFSKNTGALSSVNKYGSLLLDDPQIEDIIRFMLVEL